MSLFNYTTRPRGFGWGVPSGGIAAGTPHPEFPGCLWDPQLNNYVCDDGYTVDGQPVGGGDDGAYYDDVITTSSEAPRTRSGSELAAAVKAAGGKLTVSGNDSAIIVATNNQLRFSVTRTTSGLYEIQDRLGGSNTLVIGGVALAVVLGLLLVSSRK